MKSTRIPQIRRVLGLAAPWLFASGMGVLGCSGNGPVGGELGVGGAFGTGGRLSTGGATAAGGSATTGGVVASGGLSAGGGVNANGGGSATGGMSASGGVQATGGLSATGGNTAAGGLSATGGVTSTGGTKATGGAPNSGGASTTGGNKATGGTLTTGGVANTGGSKATGGTATTGGSVATGGAAGFSICSSAPPAGRRVVNIYVIGDSTASIYTSELYPRMGWGQVLGDYFSSACAKVVDKALSGRSSKSFYDEGAWTPIRNALIAGDFVLIQFGHNDEKSDDATRYTIPGTTYKQYLTTYVNDTLAKQAYPVLLDSIERNNWSGTAISASHGAYPAAVRELAAALGVPLVDMTALSKALFERLGQTVTTNDLFMNLAAGEFSNYPSGNTDNTHLQETGARAVAQLFTVDAYRQKLPVAANLKAIPVAP